MPTKENIGDFQLKRQNGQLTAALETRNIWVTCKLCLQLLPKVGFQEDMSTYKTYDPTPSQCKDATHEKWKANIWNFIQDNPHFTDTFNVSLVILNANNMMVQENVTKLVPPPTDNAIYLVDKIEEDTPCLLYRFKDMTDRQGCRRDGDGWSYILVPILEECTKVHIIRLVRIGTVMKIRIIYYPMRY